MGSIVDSALCISAYSEVQCNVHTEGQKRKLTNILKLVGNFLFIHKRAKFAQNPGRGPPLLGNVQKCHKAGANNSRDLGTAE